MFLFFLRGYVVSRFLLCDLMMLELDSDKLVSHFIMYFLIHRVLPVHLLPHWVISIVATVRTNQLINPSLQMTLGCYQFYDG